MNYLKAPGMIILLLLCFPFHVAAQFSAIEDRLTQNLEESVMNSIAPSEQARQTLENIEMIVSSNREQTLNFASQLQRELQDQSARSPEELMQQFAAQQQRMDAIYSQRLDQLTNQAFDVTERGINEVASGSGLSAETLVSGISTAFETWESVSEAREAQEAAVRQRNQQMRAFARSYIEANNNAILENYKNAAYALNIYEERYFMEVADFYICFNNSIQNNFRVDNTSWTRNPCTQPARPFVIENLVTSKYTQYLLAAKRKYNMYEQTNLDAFRESALKYINGTIAENPNDIEAYVLKAQWDKDLISSYSTLITAHQLDKQNAEIRRLLGTAKEDFEKEFIASVRHNTKTGAHDYAFIERAINMNLHRTISLDGKTALIYVVDEDQPDLMQLILNKEAQQTENMLGKLESLLLYTSLKDRVNCARRLIELGTDPECRVKNVTPMEAAARTGSLEVFDLLYSSSNKKSYYDAYFTGAENREVAQTFYMYKVQKAIDMNDRKEVQKYTELIEGDKAEAVALLRFSKLALTENKSWLIPILAGPLQLKYKYDKSQNFNKAMGELFTQALRGNQAFLSEIVKSGIYDEEWVGIAIQRDYDELLYQLSKKIDLNQYTYGESSTVNLIFQHQPPKVIARLSQFNIVFRLEGNPGYNILHAAAYTGNARLTDYILSQNRHLLNTKSDNGWTPLHFAARENHLEVARVLIAYGADKKIKDGDGRRPYDIADERLYEDLKYILK